MAISLDKFLKNIQVIKALNPKYRQPGDGSDGTCDCIGLIIGAIRRSGGKWTGIHGSNWAARKEVAYLKEIKSAADLIVGELVFQVYEPNSSAYALPGRYKKGGQYYNGDLRDYMHVGVVTQVNPLHITHMGSKGVKVDTTIRYWRFHGWPIKVEAPTVPAPAPIPEPAPEPNQPRTGAKAKVVASSGSYVKMRKQPTTKCSLYEELPIGTTVTIEQPGESWAKISYGRYKGWYMMAKFLEIID